MVGRVEVFPGYLLRVGLDAFILLMLLPIVESGATCMHFILKLLIDPLVLHQGRCAALPITYDGFVWQSLVLGSVYGFTMPILRQPLLQVQLCLLLDGPTLCIHFDELSPELLLLPMRTLNLNHCKVHSPQYPFICLSWDISSTFSKQADILSSLLLFSLLASVRSAVSSLRCVKY